MKLHTPPVELETASQEALRTLCDGRAELRVSLHLRVPRDAGFDELRQLPRRYERAVDAAEERLAALHVAEDERRALIEPLRGDSVELSELPLLTRGLALFASPGVVRAFALPFGVADGVRVGRGLHLRPLLAAARLEGSFRVLTIAGDQVALFESGASGLRRLEGPDVPESAADALADDFSGRASGGGASNSHGRGGAKETPTLDRERSHADLAMRAARLWAGREDPLVLVADETHQDRFRRIAALPGLLAEGVTGDPRRMRVDELFARARSLVFEERVAADRIAAERAARALAHGAAVGTLETAVAAAIAGRVLRLWLTPDAIVAKHVERDTGRLVPARGDEDALDELADLVIARGGYALVDTTQATGRDVLAELRG